MKKLHYYKPKKPFFRVFRGYSPKRAKKPFLVGDTVYCYWHGDFGVVRSVNYKLSMPICVFIGDWQFSDFTIDGRLSKKHRITLKHTQK